MQRPPVSRIKPSAAKKPRVTTGTDNGGENEPSTTDKGKGKVDDPSQQLTGRKSTRGKATLVKAIPGTSRKVPVSSAPKPTRKSRARTNATTREMNIHIPTVRARRAGTLHYKRTATTRRRRPGGILLLPLLTVVFH